MFVKGNISVVCFNSVKLEAPESLVDVLHFTQIQCCYFLIGCGVNAFSYMIGWKVTGARFIVRLHAGRLRVLVL